MATSVTNVTCVTKFGDLSVESTLPRSGRGEVKEVGEVKEKGGSGGIFKRFIFHLNNTHEVCEPEQ